MNQPCVFPFKTGGLTYRSCKPSDSNTNGWCSTETDANDNHVEGKWGYCSPKCPGRLRSHGTCYKR